MSKDRKILGEIAKIPGKSVKLFSNLKVLISRKKKEEIEGQIHLVDSFKIKREELQTVHTLF